MNLEKLFNNNSLSVTDEDVEKILNIGNENSETEEFDEEKLNDLKNFVNELDFSLTFFKIEKLEESNNKLLSDLEYLKKFCSYEKEVETKSTSAPVRVGGVEWK